MVHAKPQKNEIKFDKLWEGFSKYPRDPQVRNHYYKMYGEYTKARKRQVNNTDNLF